ncbi:MAG: DUF3810 domain-containing protein [Acidobacteriota bacterium]|nr:MAG: DUF3810 domain-containing protein [Acidobacteriota bacterium]
MPDALRPPEIVAGQPRRVRAGLVAGVVMLVGFLLSRVTPDATEMIYARGLYPPLSRTLSFISSRVPFSLFELLVVVLIAMLLVSPAIGFRRARAEGASRRRAFAIAQLRLAGELGLIWALFLLLWGFNYARPEPDRLFGLERAVEKERAEALVAWMGQRLDILREQIAEDEQGVVVFGRSFAELDAEIGLLQAEALREAGLPAPASGRAKRFVTSPVLIRWGVSGIYGPLTGEPNIVDPAPPGRLPFVIAHERAHLAGFAWEEAASLVALLTLWRSDDPALRYAGWLALWVELRRKPDNRGPGVKRDLEAMAEFARLYLGREAPALRRVYSGYLKAHGVRGGTRSYGRVAGLALRYLDTRGMPPRPSGLVSSTPPP